VNFNKKNYVIFNYGVISTRYNCVCIAVLITLKMAVWLAEICRWLLCIKLHS